MGRTKKSVQEKVQTEYPEFATEVAGETPAQLNNRLAGLAKYLEQTEEAKENDNQLEIAREQVKELSGPYNDTKKALRIKSKYIITLLREKGADA